MHYNVQSIVPKLNVLLTELYEFDILAFSETWLSLVVNHDDLLMQSYQIPEHKDRVGDNHGGVILHVKESIHYTRRNDLEPVGTESIWIDLILRHKHLLFGLFLQTTQLRFCILFIYTLYVNIKIGKNSC